MSNGTRIDPEEREPRAIKIRQPKHTGRKIVFAVLSVILVIALGGGIYAFIEYGPEFSFPSIVTKETTGSKTEEPSSLSEPDIPETPVSSEPEEEPEVPEEPEIQEEPEVPVEEEPVPEEPAKPEIPKDEWYMLLINRENPIPEDFAISGAFIDNNGHTVDERIFNDLSEMIAAGEIGEKLGGLKNLFGK